MALLVYSELPSCSPPSGNQALASAAVLFVTAIAGLILAADSGDRTARWASVVVVAAAIAILAAGIWAGQAFERAQLECCDPAVLGSLEPPYCAPLVPEMKRDFLIVAGMFSAMVGAVAAVVRSKR